MKKNLLFFFVICFSCSLHAQFTVKGIVIDQQNGAPIAYATVWFPESNVYTMSDSIGKFEAAVTVQQVPTVTHIAYEYVTFGTLEAIENTAAHLYVSLIIYMSPKNNLFPEVMITASRADLTTPVTYTNISGSELNKNNFGEDMPMLLEFTPSAVVTSDAGNGVGYTGIRIRGSDATRINVTINGVPYNDAESQQTYWVDLPDFAANADDIQLQRGVGTSSNGISSLGGAININTLGLNPKPSSSASFATGSFNLVKASASFGTGEMNEHWFIDGRISKIKSNGFIDRSFADLTSFYISSAYRGNRYSSIVNIFSGEEHTYQSWGGVPKDLLQVNRTFNPYTYENQTDNYIQTHYQWHQYLYFKNLSRLQLTLNYTKGMGYYEQLEEDQYFSDYGADDVIAGHDTITSSDLVTQKWLESNFYGAYLLYTFSKDKLDFHAGAAFYQHAGDHFGKVIWSEYASTFGTNYEWYRNDALKSDANIYTQFKYDFSNKLVGFLDLQLRSVSHSFLGYDYNESDELVNLDQRVNLLFFNPKIGITYLPNAGNLLYASLSRSGKEPNRDDYVESTPISRPKPEVLYDGEAGYKLKINSWQVQANLYFMYYIDQLVLNGQINDVGAYTRINVPESYRTGLELAGAKTFLSVLSWNANLSLSRNKIKEYSEFVDDWDTGEQLQKTYHNTALAFSPSVVAANYIEYIFLDKGNQEHRRGNHFSVALQSKFVGRQYIDNTQNESRSLDPYFVNDVLFVYQFSNSLLGQLNLKFIVQNMLDHQYESNAWVYRYIYEGTESELNGYFPQAGRNYVISLSVNF